MGQPPSEGSGNFTYQSAAQYEAIVRQMARDLAREAYRVGLMPADHPKRPERIAALQTAMQSFDRWLSHWRLQAEREARATVRDRVAVRLSELARGHAGDARLRPANEWEEAVRNVLDWLTGLVPP